MKESRKDGEKRGLKMLVFDCLRVDEFKSGKCTIPYRERHANLVRLLAQYSSPFFRPLMWQYSGSDSSMITKLLDMNVAAGEEGIMINLLDAPYEFKRSKVLLKCKKFSDIDLTVIGFEEGTNRNVGKLGALLVKYKDGNVVKVGSGFSDELRDEIWQHQSEWLGRTVTVKYFEETTNAQGGKSLRFPIYVDYRLDKEADIR